MKNIFIFLVISLISLSPAHSKIKDTKNIIFQNPDSLVLEEKLAKADWEIKEISDEIIWKYKHFHNLFNSIQSISILEIDIKQRSVGVTLDYAKTGFQKTSDVGERIGAIAAVNGSFFNTKTGGSNVFFKKRSKVIEFTYSGFTPYRENAGLAINALGEINILSKPPEGWESLKAYSDILTSGPLLLQDKKLLKQIDEPFNTNKHPRTAVGLTADGRLLAVIIDGRNPQAHGMTIQELAHFMQALGCVEAMNLDGGGSSTAWIKNHGVVNYPSDNKLFDHEGEREVVTVIGFITRPAPQIIIND